MSAHQSIAINPKLLEWARKESGFATDQVARRLQVKIERVEAWEQGERQPTMRQVEELARFFHRPLGIFFLPRPPQLSPLAAEYRRLPGLQPGHESPELRLALRQMLTRRDNALNLMGELGKVTKDFALRAHLNESPSEVGNRLRVAMRITADEQLEWANEWRAWNAWRAAVENFGVLVFQFGKVPLSEVRGIALLHILFPVIGINGKEIPEARSYTLLHELVHLMLAAGKEEAPALYEQRSGEEWTKVERFAEGAASHALIPEEALRAEAGNVGRVAWNTDAIRKLARRFRVTPLAMATRLRESNFMSWAQYQAWRETWDKYISTLPPRKGGFATPVAKAINQNGRPFAQLVLEALSSNRITTVDAARYLGLKFEHFGKLRNALWEGPSGLPAE
jgi:Zn-dependent peptidase ImmA (M78 family)